MAQLTLHIGSHKTGTTSIQFFLRQKRRELKRAGVSYLMPDEDKPGVVNANRLVATDGAGPDFRATLNEEQARLLLEPQGERNLASSETLWWFDDVAPIDALARSLRPRYDDIRLICYLRRQDLLALSHRKQVSSLTALPAARFYGFEPKALPSWRPHYMRFFDYHAKLELWAAAFGRDNIQVRLFEPQALHDGDSVSDFVQAAGLPIRPEAAAKARRYNTSNGPERTLLMIGAKAAGLKQPFLKRLEAATDDSGTLTTSQAEAKAFMAHLEEANARLAETWRLEDGAPLRFVEGFDMHPEVGTDVFTDETARRALEIVLAAAAKRKGGGRGRAGGKAGGKGGGKAGGTGLGAKRRQAEQAGEETGRGAGRRGAGRSGGGPGRAGGGRRRRRRAETSEG